MWLLGVAILLFSQVLCVKIDIMFTGYVGLSSFLCVVPLGAMPVPSWTLFSCNLCIANIHFTFGLLFSHIFIGESMLPLVCSSVVTVVVFYLYLIMLIVYVYVLRYMY